MRTLTSAEEVLRAKRFNQLTRVSGERRDVLIDFARRLELSNAGAIAAEPWAFLRSIADFMRSQAIDNDDDHVWVVTRLGYYIGELFATAFNGQWYLNDLPDSRHFLEIVVGRFRQSKEPIAMIAPFALADYFARQLPPRDLEKFVESISNELGSTAYGQVT